MYKTTAQRKQETQEEKKTALLWLFVASRGLLADFKGFYKLHHSRTMGEIDREFQKLLKDSDNG